MGDRPATVARIHGAWRGHRKYCPRRVSGKARRQPGRVSILHAWAHGPGKAARIRPHELLSNVPDQAKARGSTEDTPSGGLHPFCWPSLSLWILLWFSAVSDGLVPMNVNKMDAAESLHHPPRRPVGLKVIDLPAAPGTRAATEAAAVRHRFSPALLSAGRLVIIPTCLMSPNCSAP